MSKVLKAVAAVGLGVGALISEVVVHGYLDIMYKETIPQTLIKRIANKNGTAGMKDFAEFNKEQCLWINQQNIEEIDNKSPRGYNIKGYLLEAKEETNNYIVFAHGYRADHLGDPANFERFYHEAGYNFLAVDHTTAGKSGGDWVGFGYYEADDMLAWVDYLVTRFGPDINIILHGVSMGGATVCQMASRVPSQVKAIISDCAFTSANDEFIKVVNDAGIKRIAPYALAIINTLNKNLAGYDLAQTDVRHSVANAKVPMLFVHGKIDDFIPVEMCYELYDICGAEKDILIIDNAYHAQCISAGAEAYKAKIKEFISQYL